MTKTFKQKIEGLTWTDLIKKLKDILQNISSNFDLLTGRISTLESASSGGGSGVQSITGDLVDNTIPTSPVINTPTLAQVISEGNETGITPIKVKVTGADTSLEIGTNNLQWGDTVANKYVSLQLPRTATGSYSIFIPQVANNGVGTIGAFEENLPAPTTSASPGVLGQMYATTGFFYYYVPGTGWRRIASSSF